MPPKLPTPNYQQWSFTAKRTSTLGAVLAILPLTSPAVFSMLMVLSPPEVITNLTGASAHQEKVMSALGVPALSRSVAMTVTMVLIAWFSIIDPE